MVLIQQKTAKNKRFKEVKSLFLTGASFVSMQL